MSYRLCVRLGVAAGGVVGLLVAVLRHADPPPGVPPTFLLLALAGLIAALLGVFIAAGFACLVDHLPVAPVFTLAFLIGIITGVLLGPLAYHIPNPGISVFVCALLGALLGWLVCRVVCGGARVAGVPR